LPFLGIVPFNVSDSSRRDAFAGHDLAYFIVDYFGLVHLARHMSEPLQHVKMTITGQRRRPYAAEAIARSSASGPAGFLP